MLEGTIMLPDLDSATLNKFCCPPPSPPSLSPPSSRSLMCLSSLSVVDEMSELFRNNLLPLADEVAALSLQFAQPPMADSADINDLGQHQINFSNL